MRPFRGAASILQQQEQSLTALQTFVAQCQEDYDTFNRCVNDEGCLGRKANINTWFRTVNPDRMPQPPMSHDEVRCRWASLTLHVADALFS